MRIIHLLQKLFDAYLGVTGCIEKVSLHLQITFFVRVKNTEKFSSSLVEKYLYIGKIVEFLFVDQCK
jgi:hypothetical protein